MPAKQPFRRVGRGGQTSYGSRGGKSTTIAAQSLLRTERTSKTEKFEPIRLANRIDEAMGFPRFEAGRKRVGWLINMRSTLLEDEKIPGGRAGVDYYFIDDDGGSFKATVEYDPYFMVAVRRGREAVVEEWVRRSFEGIIKNVRRLDKEDLSMPNHLMGYRRTLLKLEFANVGDLLSARKVIMPIAEKNKKKVSALDTYAEVASANAGFDIFDEEDNDRRKDGFVDASDFIVDIREYDVPYHVRVAIDKSKFFRLIIMAHSLTPQRHPRWTMVYG
jgi:DNA polymerase epsilon subunit 1